MNDRKHGRRGFLERSVAAATATAGALLLSRTAFGEPKKGSDKKQATPAEGTLIRGADGELYYVPDDKLAAFKVGRDQHEALKKDFGKNFQRQLGRFDGEALAKVGINANKTQPVLLVDIKQLRLSVSSYKPSA
jgi:hypothetical protein